VNLFDRFLANVGWCRIGWHRVPNKVVTRRRPVDGKLVYPFWNWEGVCRRCHRIIKGVQ
jgi:hypothetical protein